MPHGHIPDAPPPRVPGHPVWESRGGHRNGSSSAPWSSSPTSCPRSRFWMLLCRSWWNSCWTSCNSFVRSHLILSRLSKCPRSCLVMSLCEPLLETRSWRNSWWKCRRSYLFPRYSGLWSRTWPFQFLVVEGDFQVFKVFFPDRVQQRRSFLKNALLSGLWSRS